MNDTRKVNRDFNEDLEVLRSSRYICLLDLEATCAEENYPPDEMESIQIGVVMYDTHELCVVDEYMAYVKPVLHCELTDFCTKLTGVKQSDVDNAKKFPEAFSDMLSWASQWCRPDELVIASWGNYDCNQFLRDARRHDYALPEGFVERHINLSYVSAKQNSVPRKQRSLKQSVHYYGYDMIGRHHDALDDARSMAQLLPKILFGSDWDNNRAEHSQDLEV